MSSKTNKFPIDFADFLGKGKRFLQFQIKKSQTKIQKKRREDDRLLQVERRPPRPNVGRKAENGKFVVVQKWSTQRISGG